MGARRAYVGRPEKQRNKRVVTKHARKAKEELLAAEEAKSPLSNVLYLGHIPHGFYQPQITAYFKQFGHVQRVRLARSKKTMRSKGYAFVQFESKEVCKIAAESMNNYLTFERVMKCHPIPENKLHERTFRNWKAQMKPWRRPIKAREVYNAHKKPLGKTLGTAHSNLKKTQKKLAEMGFDFNIDLVMKPHVQTTETNDDTIPATTPRPTVVHTGSDTAKDFIIPFEEYILVDSSDDEVTFKTPPASVRVLRKKAMGKNIA